MPRPRSPDSYRDHSAALEAGNFGNVEPAQAEAVVPHDSPWRQLVAAVASGATTGRLLRAKRPDVRVFRASLADGGSVIVKLWNRGGVRHWLRSLRGRCEPRQEARALARLNEHSVPSPRLLAAFRLGPAEAPSTHAMVVEDLGECERVVELVELLTCAREEARVTDIERQVVHITAGMIDAGVLDLDHSLNNMLMPPTGVIARVDLEFAVCCEAAARRPRLYGTMLGRLIGTYTFAVQPRLDRVSDFAERLYDRVSPPKAVRRHARRYVSKMMAKQRQVHGIKCQPVLPD